MNSPTRIRRPLGTMVAFGFDGLPFSVDLALASRIGASVLEILPDWEREPDALLCRRYVENAGLTIGGAHGSWGRRSFTGERVDLGSIDGEERRISVGLVKRCADWIDRAGGRYLVVHPGSLSLEEERNARRSALLESLGELADHVRGGGPAILVENMPPGVHPGSRMADLRELVDEIDQPHVRLILDTGHARLSSDPTTETLAASDRLVSLHVHDNDVRADLHLIPGDGVIDWSDWGEALDRVEYRGAIMLECVRKLRHGPNGPSARFLTLMANLTADPRVEAARDAATA